MKTGDIFFRLGRQTFMGIPFEKLVAYTTRSEYSHASVALVRNGEVYMLEINDMGTMLIRLVDWLDYCAVKKFGIYRLPLTPEQTAAVEASIDRFVEADPDYDFTFSDDSKFYCTESVAYVYEDAGIPLAPPKLIKAFVKPWGYAIFWPINWVLQKLTGTGLSTSKPLHFVGNSNQGLMSTPGLSVVYTHELVREGELL